LICWSFRRLFFSLCPRYSFPLVLFDSVTSGRREKEDSSVFNPAGFSLLPFVPRAPLPLRFFQIRVPLEPRAYRPWSSPVMNQIRANPPCLDNGWVKVPSSPFSRPWSAYIEKRLTLGFLGWIPSPTSQPFSLALSHVLRVAPLNLLRMFHFPFKFLLPQMPPPLQGGLVSLS